MPGVPWPAYTTADPWALENVALYLMLAIVALGAVVGIVALVLRRRR